MAVVKPERPAPDQQTLADLYEFRSWLIRETSFVDMLVTVRPGCPDKLFATLAASPNGWPEPVLVGLFCLGRDFPAEIVGGRMPSEFVELLMELGILRLAGDRMSSNFMIVLHGPCLLFTSHVGPRMPCYYGTDSFALSRTLNSAIRPGRAVDLCCGPGAHTLALASQGFEVSSFDINPTALGLLEINAHLNRLGDRIIARRANVLEGVPPKIAEIVCMNPPLLPVPEELAYPLVAHGGADGFKFARAVLPAMSRMLAQRGLFYTLGMSYGDETGPAFLDDLECICGKFSLDAYVHVVSTVSFAEAPAMMQSIMTTAAKVAVGPGPDAAAMEAFIRRDARGFDGYCLYYLRATHGTGKVTVSRSGMENGEWFL